MWIRTQDRNRLKDVKDVGQSINGLKIYAYEYFGEYCHSTYLGEYPTKERCIEVLDEIQQAFIGKLLIPINGQEIKHLPDVYQMPEV